MNNQGLGPGVSGSGDLIGFGHGGANEGYRCQLFALTKLGQGVVIMTNRDRGGELVSEILRSFSKEYQWTPFKPSYKSIVPITDRHLERLTGQYQLTIQGNELILEIEAQENYLKGVQIWDNFSFEMYPESDTRFFNKDDGTGFEFSMDENGNVSTFTVYEGGQVYIFKKN